MEFAAVGRAVILSRFTIHCFRFCCRGMDDVLSELSGLVVFSCFWGNRFEIPMPARMGNAEFFGVVFDLVV